MPRSGRESGNILSLLQHIKHTHPGSPSRAINTLRFLGGELVSSAPIAIAEDLPNAAGQRADGADESSDGYYTKSAVGRRLLEVLEAV